ncbi:MAG: [ribosomal protein S5]-alanine N-acetyltransferase [Actinomycetota bacterium]
MSAPRRLWVRSRDFTTRADRRALSASELTDARHNAPVSLELRGLVLLRDFRPNDRSGLVALAHDEAVSEYTKFRFDEATAVRWLENFVNEPNASPRKHWGLVIESLDGEFVRWAGVDGRGKDDEAEIGWYLASRYWDRGYATETTRLLIDFACDTLKYRRLFATADPENAASRRVLEKSGFEYVGIVDHVPTWRGPRPRLIFELLRVP